MNIGKSEVLVIENHSLIMEGICKVLRKLSDTLNFTIATTGQEAEKIIHQRNFDIYILDISMPDIDNFKLIDTIREEQDEAKVIINTICNEPWVTDKLIDLQVNAVISKTCDSRELEQAIRHVLKNEAYCSTLFDTIRRKLRNGRNIKMHKDDYPTKRELDVLKKIATGDTTNQIAAKLGISENTVETFRKRLIQKFDAKNAIDLVMKAINKGWIDAYE